MLKEKDLTRSNEPVEEVTVEFDDSDEITPVPLFVTRMTMTEYAGMKSSDSLEEMILALEKKRARAIEE